MADNMYSKEMGWNDSIQEDGVVRTILKEGDYEFKVTGFERSRFNGSEKTAPCNKAILTLEVESVEGTTTVRTDLLLTKSLEWKISSFFRSIGLKKHGQAVVMDWNKVLGSKGRAHLKVRQYINKYGETKECNDVAYFIDYDPDYDKAPFSDSDDIPF